MKSCNECRDENGGLIHPSSEGCNWFDRETVCPHCGGELRWFRPTSAGDLMDEMSMEPPSS